MGWIEAGTKGLGAWVSSLWPDGSQSALRSLLVDGIIGGALANRHIHMHTSSVATSVRLSRNPDEAISKAKAQMVNKAVMNKCDTLKEGFLNNPHECKFDFSSLLCKGEDSDACLTKAQLRTVEE